MRRFAPALLLALSLSGLLAAPAQAVPGGRLDVLERGLYRCELPGDAVTAPTAVDEQTFRAVPDSSYIAADGTRGPYLLLGKELTMTGGALKGARYHLQTPSFLRRIGDDGLPGPLRCVRAGEPGVPLQGLEEQDGDAVDPLRNPDRRE